MNVHFSFKAEKTSDTQREIDQQLQKLERRLQVFRPELVHLHGAMDQGARQSILCSLNLRLPSGQLACSDQGATGAAAVKAAFADLLRELNKHKDLLRSQHKWRHQARSRRGEAEGTQNVVDRVAARSLSVQEPGEAVPVDNGQAQQPPLTAESFTDGSGASGSEVRTYINANLARLERFIERELRNRVDTLQIPPNTVSKDEVLDEVIVEALSAEEHPKTPSVERWLFRLAVHAMRRVSHENTEHLGNGVAVQLAGSAGKPNVTASDDSFLQFHHPDEFLSHQDEISQHEQGTPEEIAASDEMIGELESALRDTSGEDRETLVLFAIEGFTIDEIAHITGRNPESVKHSIVTARGTLAKKLPSGNLLKKRLLQQTGAA